MSSHNYLRWFQTMNVNFIAVTHGMACAMYGATLVDVAAIYGESIEATSRTLTARGLGTIFSSLIGALVYKHVNIQIMLLGTAVFGMTAAVLTTILPSLIYLHVLTFFVGCSMGFMDIGVHVWLQVLWKERSGSFFHFMNFMFGVGGIIGPFVCEPFLLETRNAAMATENSTMLGVNTTVESSFGDTTPVVKHGILTVGGESRIFTAYSIIAAINAFIAISMIVSYCMDSTDFKPNKNATYFSENLGRTERRTVLTLLALYLTVGVTCEISFSAMVYTFAVNHSSLNFSKSQAAYLTSLYWASYTISRVFTTILSLTLSPAQLIVGSHFIYLSSALSMMLFINSSPMLSSWLGTALVAFGLSPYWANATAWSVQYVQLTPAALGPILVVISSGVMLIPFFIGNQIDKNPQFFLYSNTALALLLTALAATLIIYGNTKALVRHKTGKEAERLNAH
ncbi:sodium-dependent glucose transporter 1 [Galendromus occidentalis]|uniref:Sodium-dependent glucose transporter 1 n=1 Tax=Galendromus occidentalis TaxID=34638 RepID=A0AAJ6QYG9_9ACAR|nr:sodium-dependent glucose transporter 1 [Galendromus occidentalis]